MFDFDDEMEISGRKSCPDPSAHFTYLCREAIPEAHRRRAKIALDYYNKKNGTDYEPAFDDLASSNCFESDGIWFHFNFRTMRAVDGKYFHKTFFAEIQADVSTGNLMTQALTVTACVIVELGGTKTGCGICSNVFHPFEGYLKGIFKKKDSDTMFCSPSYSPLSTPPSSPGEENPDSSVGMQIVEGQANIALEHFNKENGTDYKLVEVLKCNSIYIEQEYWFHCNFKASSPKGDSDGESSSKLFFAENFAVIAESVTWTANACHLLDGKTIDGCIFCRGIFHPTHGYHQGIARLGAEFIRDPANGNKVPHDLPSTEKDAWRAEIAIDFYNHNNSTHYDVVEVFLCKCFSSDGTSWYHCNFEAKQDVDGKYTSRMFFAELFTDNEDPIIETLTVTACQILDGENTGHCGFCSNVLHPSQGDFLKRIT